MQEAVDWIYSIRGSAWRRKLDRMERLVELMGVPHGGDRPFVHVAGTNGKGSTVTMVEAMLRAAGFSTGHCVSPYVYSVLERVAVNGKPIPEEDFVRVATLARDAVDQLKVDGFKTCTVFEVFTAMAFYYWQDQNVDFGVAEVGLGGTLDCTNIINPVVSAIVSISWDHTEVLGGSLEEIAAEKAGVIKAGKPCVIGDLPQEAREVVFARSEEVGAPLSVYSRDWEVKADRDSAEFELSCGFGTFVLPKPRRLPGQIQVHNAGIAAQCFLYATEGKLDLNTQVEAMQKGLMDAFLPGRFEVFRHGGRTWIFDGAHNEQSFAELVRTFRQQFPKIQPNVLFGMLNRHDARPCADLLRLLGGSVRCVPIKWELGADPEKLAEECGFERWHSTLSEAFDALDSNVVLVAGSFYLLGDCRELLDSMDGI